MLESGSIAQYHSAARGVLMATPAIFKRVTRTNVIQSILGFTVATYIKLFSLTWRIDGGPIPVKGPYILAVWHGRLLMLPTLRETGKPLVALISGHRDDHAFQKEQLLL